jgi:hypothetical protein
VGRAEPKLLPVGVQKQNSDALHAHHGLDARQKLLQQVVEGQVREGGVGQRLEPLQLPGGRLRRRLDLLHLRHIADAGDGEVFAGFLKGGKADLSREH